MKSTRVVSLCFVVGFGSACTFIDDFGSFRACDATTQDCPTGFACVALETGSSECRAAGQSCQDSAACGSGLECVGSPARCQYSCSTQSDCDEHEGGLCGDSQITSASVCTVDCDLRSGLPCASGLTCGVDKEGTTFFTTCIAAGLNQLGEQCDEEHRCAPGLQCFEGDDAAGQCYQWCQTLADCETAQLCVQAVEIQGQSWGFCTSP